MARYRKKPVEVEAFHYVFDSGAVDRLCEFMGTKPGDEVRPDRLWDEPDWPLLIWIEKSAAFGRIVSGDYVIAERDGVGFYPCVRAQFDETYEAVV